MSIPNTTGLQRRPTHPGEMLREDFLPDYNLTVSTLAEAIGVLASQLMNYYVSTEALARKWRYGWRVCLATRQSFG